MPSTEDAAAPAVLARQLSSAEKAGMLEVLSLVEEEEGALRDKGMSKFTFFFGLANLLLSAFLIGASPESFWIVYACQAVVIIGYRIYVEARRGKNTVDEPGVLLYFLDFCWVCNMFFAALSFVVLLEVLDDVLVSKFPALVERKPWLRPPELNFARSTRKPSARNGRTAITKPSRAGRRWTLKRAVICHQRRSTSRKGH